MRSPMKTSWILAALLASTPVAAGAAQAKAEDAGKTADAGTAEGRGFREAPWKDSSIKDWAKVPAPAKERTYRPPVPKTLRLKNGVRVLVVERHTLPLVSAVLVVDGAGSASDPEGKAGLASFTGDLMEEGAGDLGALELAAETERLGATLTTSVDRDAGFVSLSTLSRTLGPSLELLTEVVARPRLDPKDEARLAKERLTDLKLRVDRPMDVADVVLGAALYGRGTPYGHPIEGYVDSFQTIDLSDVKAFYASRWQPSRMTLVVAGDVSVRALKKMLDQSLGAWNPPKAKLPPTRATKPQTVSARLLLVDRKGAPQSAIRAGLVGMKRTDPRYYGFEVLNTILGGGFTSRLNHRLREELGFTYGAGSAMDWRLQPGPFFVATSVFTPKTAESAKEIVRIVGELAKTPVPKAELEKARLNLVRALPMRFETNGGVVSAYADLAESGLPLGWYATYQRKIDGVGARSVMKVAGQVIPEGRLVFVVVGDVAAVRGDLEQDIGPAVLYAPTGEPLTVKAEKTPAEAGAKDGAAK